MCACGACGWDAGGIQVEYVVQPMVRKIAITIGSDHPFFLAGQTVIEAKAARAKPGPADGCDCPVDHSEAEAAE